MSSEEMDVVDSWLETFTARISGTSALDNLLENIGEHLAHPSFPAICVAIRNASQLLCSNSCDASLKWTQVAMDFTWERLHSGNWKDVNMGWRETYSIAVLLKAANLSKRRQFREALMELDKGIMMGAPVLDNALPSFATALTAEIRKTEHKILTETDSADIQTDSNLKTSSKAKKVVFKNYKQFADTANGSPVQQMCSTKQDSTDPGFSHDRGVKKMKMEESKQTADNYPSSPGLHIPLIDPANRVPVVLCPSLEAFHQHYMETSTPTVITGAMDHWPAYSARKWR